MAKDKLTVGDVKAAVLDYAKFNTKCKKVNDRLEEMKQHFYTIMESYFAELRGKSKVAIFEYINEDGFSGILEVQRIQSSSVEFDIDKVEVVLGKERSKNAIQKVYEINDIVALTSYLKECGVNPKVFRSFVTVNKTINKSELDRLEEIGELNIKELKDCYTLTVNSPYFKVKVKKN